jgi:hypothetical protein
MTTDIVGSKIPADNSAPGQDGYAGASSLLPGQKAPVAANKVAPPFSDPGIAGRGSDVQDTIQHRVGGAQIAAHPAQAHRPPYSGSPAGTVPPSGRPSKKPATPGTFNRK